MYIRCKCSLRLYECMCRCDKELGIMRTHPVHAARASRTWGETLIERRCLATGVLATFFPSRFLSLSLSIPLQLSPDFSHPLAALQSVQRHRFHPRESKRRIRVSTICLPSSRTSDTIEPSKRPYRQFRQFISVTKWLIDDPLKIIY